MEVTRTGQQRDQILEANIAGPFKRMIGSCRYTLAEVSPCWRSHEQDSKAIRFKQQTLQSPPLEKKRSALIAFLRIQGCARSSLHVY